MLWLLLCASRESGDAEAHGHARTDVVAERHRAQQPCAVDAALLADRERRRYHGAARMRQRRGMGIVGLVGMRQHAVSERRLDRTREQVAADDGGHARATLASEASGQRGYFMSARAGHSPGLGSSARAAVALDESDRGLAGQKRHARDHGGDGVEYVVLALLDHVVGQRALACFTHIGAECRHDRAYRGGAPRRAGAEPGGRESAAAFEDAPTRQRAASG
jgi:hypothetical protein